MRVVAVLLGVWVCLTPAWAAPVSPQARTAALFDRIVTSPPRLRMFLQAMPKGADLHNHVSGAVYAEDFIRWAAEDGLCIDTASDTIVAPPCDRPGRMTARDAVADYPVYSKVIETLSMRDFENGIGDPGVSGYDRFFATFAGFGPTGPHSTGRTIAAARENAAYNNVGYMELMLLPHAVRELYAKVKTDDTGTDFDALAALLMPALPAAIAHARAEMDANVADADAAGGCNAASPGPGCEVAVRYIFAASRIVPPAQVFAALSLGFALAEADSRFVGVNIVAPEHDPVSVRDYGLHMRMFAWLKAHHPGVKLSLHAGELTLGLVAPRDLRGHIHDAVAIAGADRIGHGVDISYEADAPALLARMAHDRIAVEINLTSNAVILGVKGKNHPLSLYRAYGVPVTLSTDDPGVSRSDMTNEYMRAALEQGLRYGDLKQVARNGLEYSFLPGASLWQSKIGGARIPACNASLAAPACAAFLAGSAKAAQQAQLERDLAAFEAEQR